MGRGGGPYVEVICLEISGGGGGVVAHWQASQEPDPRKYTLVGGAPATSFWV